MGARGFRPYSRPSAAVSGAALLVAAFVGCGGEDQGRPPPPAAATGGTGGMGTVDCDADRDLELISVTDFEGPPATSAPGTPGSMYPPIQGTALSCNRALLAMGSSGEGGAGGEAGSSNAAGAPNVGSAPVCDFNFNYDQTGDLCDRDPVSSGESTCNLSIGSPWVGSEVPGGRCGQPTHAYHLEATSMGVCFNSETGRRGWGSNFLIEFEGSTNPDGVEIDASAWQGIAFWARLGDGPTNETISIVVGDAETSGADYEDPHPSGWPACQVADCIGPVGSCVTTPDVLKCDPFGIVVTLTPDWTFYSIAFADLKQKGYGQEAPKGTLDPSRIRRIQISTSTGDWDFFVDDISFYRSRP